MATNRCVCTSYRRLPYVDILTLPFSTMFSTHTLILFLKKILFRLD